MNINNSKAYKVAMTGLFAALSYVVFTFMQVKITLPGGDATSIHLGNAVVVLGALLLGGPLGGLAGAIGMSIGDLFDPVYITYVPKTFVLKLCIGLITGLIAHKIGKISTCNDSKKVFKWSLLAAIAGLLFNVIFDPLVGYYYKLLILGRPAADLTLAWNVASTSINAVTSTIVSVVVYNALRPALKKAGLLPEIGSKSQDDENTSVDNTYVFNKQKRAQ
jgi:uncharacterized membrane protein